MKLRKARVTMAAAETALTRLALSAIREPREEIPHFCCGWRCPLCAEMRAARLKARTTEPIAIPFATHPNNCPCPRCDYPRAETSE